MKKSLIYCFMFCSIALINFSSCGGDDDEMEEMEVDPLENVDCTSSSDVYLAIADETNALSAAATAYSTNPNSSNCNDFKDAYIAYIDALKIYADCADEAGVGAEFLTSLEDAELSLSFLAC